MTDSRYDRQVRFFGEEGQEKLESTSVGVIGTGGLGSHVVQQLAFLGIGEMLLVDPDVLESSNANREVGPKS